MQSASEGTHLNRQKQRGGFGVNSRAHSQGVDGHAFRNIIQRTEFSLPRSYKCRRRPKRVCLREHVCGEWGHQRGEKKKNAFHTRRLFNWKARLSRILPTELANARFSASHAVQPAARAGALYTPEQQRADDAADVKMCCSPLEWTCGASNIKCACRLVCLRDFDFKIIREEVVHSAPELTAKVFFFFP